MVKPQFMKSRVVLASTGMLVCVLALSAPPAPKGLSSYDPQVKKLLAQMTLEEKIGQMTQPEQSALKDPADVEHYFVGSLLSGGDSDPKEGNSLEAWTNLYDRLQARTANTRLRIPILYGIDAVHGHNNVLGAVVFPHNVGLGCTRNPKLVEQVERATAEEVRATGIQWTFAPCVTVPQDIRWGRTYEGFSEDTGLVTQLGEAAVRGLQGPDLANPVAALACAKHFIGDGGTTFGTAQGGKGLDQGDTRVDEATLRRLYLPPYIAAVKAGVGTIMPSYNTWNGVKCSASKRLLTEILKQELGFEGFLISDYNAIDQITPDYKEAVRISIDAGMDMAMVPTRYREFFDDVKALVQEGKLPMSRIDDAVTRILRVKFAMGMLSENRSLTADRKLQKSFGSAEHRKIARQAVRESMVLLKNDGRVLPLSKKAARIHVAGKSADNIGNQCGGWTIDWQGKTGDVTTGGTTILAAIRAAVGKGTQVTTSQDGTGAAGADVAIAVIGETPYAEMRGDRADLALSAVDLQTIANLKTAGIPVVTVVVSGRPVTLDGVLDRTNALLAAWLPGTEGAGVADVLFGDYKPTGKLSFTWPRSMAQMPINKNTGGDPLFKYGFGLSY
jgi:beta-glucosidase